eukprot:TRINITY_DN8581_c0_g1_i1.p1 TRINITY_DN8581_c0_g1~~TRINITY_DN8581_c0_g1_i1.p1  ORF type:complete len:365 (+),score=106.44 TRINITY_DN8581_c0_g1_i1:174-1268(+)
MAPITGISPLVSVTILEKDSNNEVIPVWSYPNLEKGTEDLVLKRANLGADEADSVLQFHYSKFERRWLYIFTQSDDDEEEKAFDEDAAITVSAFSICLQTTTFNPEMGSALCKLMATEYAANKDPVKILNVFLSVFTTGEHSGDDEESSFAIADHDVRRAYLVTPLTAIVRMFGMETIILWNALMMKRRVAVYTENHALLLRAIRAIPLLVWHRQNWDVLWPHVNMEDNEIEDLTKAGVYCAGFTDDAIEGREDLYDVFVNLDARRIHVNDQVRADFMMTSFHKDVAKFLVENAEDEDTSDQALIKGLAMKTKDMLTKLQSLAVEPEDGGTARIDLHDLNTRKLPPNMAQFLFNMATAEGLETA